MAVIAVLNTSDNGAGSLRAAINAAMDGDTIQFDANASGEIDLAAELFINKNLTIHGLGTAATTRYRKPRHGDGSATGGTRFGATRASHSRREHAYQRR